MGNTQGQRHTRVPGRGVVRMGQALAAIDRRDDTGAEDTEAA